MPLTSEGGGKRARVLRLHSLCVIATLLGACSAFDRDLQLFVSGDIKNAEAIARAANNTVLVDCLVQLEPVAMASPAPANDGLLVVAARAAVLQAAVSGACGAVLAPLMLRIQGKLVPAPFGVLLPF